MTQTARSGNWRPSLDAHKLTVTGVSPVTVVFTDRPERRATTVTTQSLVDNWTKAFGNDSPNAAVQLTGVGNDLVTAIVTLSNPVYNANTSELAYTAKLIGADSDGGGTLSSFNASNGDLPATFGAVSIFIDGTNVTIPTDAPGTKCTKKGSPGGTPVKMSVVNTSAYSDHDVYVALTGKTLADYKSWDANPRDLINTSVRLDCLPRDPSVKGGHGYSFELGEGIGAGLLWISLGAPITSGLPDTQPSFDSTMYRFANVEFAYPGQGDMTNVDQFSFPVDLDTYGKSSLKVVESSHFTANTCPVVRALKKAVVAHRDRGARWPQVVVNDDGKFVRVVSPKQRAKQLAKNGATPNPYAQGWPSLEPYLRSMADKTLIVRGLFTPGAGSAYANETGWYSYTAKFDKASNVTLTGTIGAPLGAGPGGRGARRGSEMKVEARGTDTDTNGKVVANDDLLTGLYDQSSRYFVAGAARNGMKHGVNEPAAPDDVYNAAYRDFVTAFTYGYWGGRYGDNNEKFWGSFAPPGAPTGGKPAFAAARTDKDPKVLLPFNLWSETMFRYSNNYNIPYGEDYGSGALHRPSPLLDVPVGGTWRMTIKGDGRTGCLHGL